MSKVEKWFEDGWDNGVDKYEEQFGKNFWTELYRYAYKFMEDGDADGGICFKTREDAVQHLLEDARQTEYAVDRIAMDLLRTKEDELIVPISQNGTKKFMSITIKEID